MERPAHDPSQRRPHGVGDAWVDGPHGRFWGTFGAAGLLLAHPEAGVLLQHRAIWSHHGGTWGVPGGARKPDETAEAAAIRESDEEAGVPPELVRVLGTSVFDVGYWSYTTVLAVAADYFEPYLGDAESIALSWVPFANVESLPLHPGLASGWPMLRSQLVEFDPRLGAL
jgi:8-oxo-dGTP diphosphatase